MPTTYTDRIIPSTTYTDRTTASSFDHEQGELLVALGGMIVTSYQQVSEWTDRTIPTTTYTDRTEP